MRILTNFIRKLCLSFSIVFSLLSNANPPYIGLMPIQKDDGFLISMLVIHNDTVNIAIENNPLAAVDHLDLNILAAEGYTATRYLFNIGTEYNRNNPLTYTLNGNSYTIKMPQPGHKERIAILSRQESIGLWANGTLQEKVNEAHMIIFNGGMCHGAFTHAIKAIDATDSTPSKQWLKEISYNVFKKYLEMLVMPFARNTFATTPMKTTLSTHDLWPEYFTYTQNPKNPSMKRNITLYKLVEIAGNWHRIFGHHDLQIKEALSFPALLPNDFSQMQIFPRHALIFLDTISHQTQGVILDPTILTALTNYAETNKARLAGKKVFIFFNGSIMHTVLKFQLEANNQNANSALDISINWNNSAATELTNLSKLIKFISQLKQLGATSISLIPTDNNTASTHNFTQGELEFSLINMLGTFAARPIDTIAVDNEIILQDPDSAPNKYNALVTQKTIIRSVNRTSLEEGQQLLLSKENDILLIQFQSTETGTRQAWASLQTMVTKGWMIPDAFRNLWNKNWL